jgi:hypothetical protein
MNTKKPIITGLSMVICLEGVLDSLVVARNQIQGKPNQVVRKYIEYGRDVLPSGLGLVNNYMTHINHHYALVNLDTQTITAI